MMSTRLSPLKSSAIMAAVLCDSMATKDGWLVEKLRPELAFR